MGFFDFLKGEDNEKWPPDIEVPTIMPQQAIDQINKGLLPNLIVNKLVLASGEICHFNDLTVNVVEKSVVKNYRSSQNSVGTKILGSLGVRHAERDTKVEMGVHHEFINSYLYVTNQRIVLIAKREGFNKKIKDIIGYELYQEGIMIQFEKRSYVLLLNDASIANRVLQILL